MINFKDQKIRLRRLFIGIVIAVVNVSCSKDQVIDVKVKEIVTFPAAIEPTCREGVAKIYDECGSQQMVLNQALQAAKQTDKTVLISYGAEWCIWCHVFDQYVKGSSREFDYQWQYHDGENLSWSMQEKANKNAETEAQALNHYFADNFVLAHIESYYSVDGEQVLFDLGYDVDSIVGVPLILVLDQNGQIADRMKSSNQLIGLEIRSDSGREFRGYDRKLLLAELKRLKKSSENHEPWQSF
ncbi:MAG: thioredoxin family protein [Marinicella sp.]